jgi:hypothetical protein
MVKGQTMKFKVFILMFASFFVLATSFCAHQKKYRGLSSTEMSSQFKNVEPLVRKNSKGHKLFVYEKLHHSRSASMLVEYQCQGGELLFWESFDIERFLGISEVLKDSVVRLRYIPMGILDFSNTSKTPTKEEVESTLPLDKLYDLSIACAKK